MTNLLNVLKAMETETEGVKNDVINYLLEMSQDSEDAKSTLDDIVEHGCQSGMVNHLIYTKDTVAYYEAHSEEIDSFITEVLGIDDLESWDGIQTLSEFIPSLDDADTRYMDAHENATRDAIIEMERCHTSEELDGMTDDEREELLSDYFEDELMYINPLELNDLDKNCLAWAIFEDKSRQLQDELEEMEEGEGSDEDIEAVSDALNIQGFTNITTGDSEGRTSRIDYSAHLDMNGNSYKLFKHKPIQFGYASGHVIGDIIVLITEDYIIGIKEGKVVYKEIK